MRSVILLLLLTTSVPAAELTLNLALRWQNAPLGVPSPELPTVHGQVLRITRFSALVSNLVLLSADGSRVQLAGQYGFVDAESNRMSVPLQNVPTGDYAGLEFQIGLSPSVNHGDPGQWPARHALNPIVNGLHWSWTGGYVFAAIEGRWSSVNPSSPGSTDPLRGFSYHLATDERLMRIRFVSRFSVSGPTSVALALDLARVLGSQRLSPDDGSESTHSGPGDSLAVSLATALERAWFFLEAVPTIPATQAVMSGSLERGDLTATPRAFIAPRGFPQPELPADNPLTEQGVALGQRLFHDRRLSAGNGQSCASCHQEDRAFSDDRALSPGVSGAVGSRNSMPLFNLAWSPHYAWDGGQEKIRDQVRAAIINPLEMQADLAVVTAELNHDAGLRAMFAEAFGGPEISAERILLALEQYLLTLTATDSKFDQALRGEAQLTEDEQRGFTLFATENDLARGVRGADCFHCHGGALFTDYSFRDNGLGDDTSDQGRAEVTQRSGDRGKFKTPSLRNIALTAPYMHDGRFAKLEDVVAHYDHGVSRTANLDPNLAKHPEAGLQLSADDQRALVAFLRTLTDPRNGLL